MNIKTELCDAFCGALEVNAVPAGFAISTGQEGIDGDLIGFYVVGPNAEGMYRVQDDGLFMTYIESAGGDTGTKARRTAFDGLCEGYGVARDDDSGELVSPYVRPTDVGATALRFLTFLLRVQDLIWMSTERAASTFREEATKMLADMLGDKARLIPDYVVSRELQEFPADIGIVADGKPPVALFFATSDLRISEAMLLQAYAANSQTPCSVLALLETEGAVSSKSRQRANNHLTAVPHFRGEEVAACARIAREALGYDPRRH